jgi:hypothetical protein
MVKVYLVNFATPDFYESQEKLNKSALQFGIDETISYTFDMLKETNFYKRNEALLQAKRGAGYFSWKPYIILEVLKKIKEGDILVYCDSGISFKASLKEVIERCNKKGIVIFGSTPINRQLTKRDCFVLMDCDKKEYHDTKQVMGGLNLWKNTPTSRKIVSEWLKFCEDRRVISDDNNVCGKPNFPDFVEHRWDQSILSVLAVKYKDYIDRVGDLEYAYYDEDLKGYNSSLWDVHRQRKRKPLDWIIWKIKLITPVSLKDRIKWFINNYIKR